MKIYTCLTNTGAPYDAMIDGGGTVVGDLQAVVLVVLQGAGGVRRELEGHVTRVRAVRALRERKRGLRFTLQDNRLCYVARGTTCNVVELILVFNGIHV